MDYNEITVQWDDAHRYSPAPRHRRRLIFAVIKKLSFMSCLDAGCAQPYLLETLSGGGTQLFGCDISDKVITANRERFKNALFEVVDITKKTYSQNMMFDLVVSSEVLEHVDDWRSAVKNLCAMSKKYLLITVPSGRVHAIDEMVGHIRHYTVNELSAEVEKHGFKVILSRRWGFPFHSLYKYAINAVAPRKVYENYAGGKYTAVQKSIANVLYGLFYANDLFRTGQQLLLLAERKQG